MTQVITQTSDSRELCNDPERSTGNDEADQSDDVDMVEPTQYMNLVKEIVLVFNSSLQIIVTSLQYFYHHLHNSNLYYLFTLSVKLFVV